VEAVESNNNTIGQIHQYFVNFVLGKLVSYAARLEPKVSLLRIEVRVPEPQRLIGQLPGHAHVLLGRHSLLLRVDLLLVLLLHVLLVLHRVHLLVTCRHLLLLLLILLLHLPLVLVRVHLLLLWRHLLLELAQHVLLVLHRVHLLLLLCRRVVLGGVVVADVDRRNAASKAVLRRLHHVAEILTTKHCISKHCDTFWVVYIGLRSISALASSFSRSPR
jgi:hypothetical protein